MHIDKYSIITDIIIDGRGSVARATAFLRDAWPVLIVM